MVGHLGIDFSLSFVDFGTQVGRENGAKLDPERHRKNNTCSGSGLRVDDGKLQRLKSYFPIPITWNHCTRMDSALFDKSTLVADELKRLRSSIAMRIVYTVFVPQRRHSQSYFQEFQEDWDSHSIPGNVIPRILQQVQKAIGEKNILLLVDEVSKTLVPKNV